MTEPVRKTEFTDDGLLEEWVEAFDGVAKSVGRGAAEQILARLAERAQQHFIDVPIATTTAYRNTIDSRDEPVYPGEMEVERHLRALTRWNAATMVLRSNQKHEGIGGHLSTFASTATLYDVGWNHFFRGKNGDSGRDFVFFQPHASPGVYARAFLEGRIEQERLDDFRAELVGGLPGLPHPCRMPDFWEFPTGSMGIGPLNAVYLARFNRYLQNRGLTEPDGSHVWVFMGDGEADEPESIGALSLAAREGLDNLTFVVNCNLQRLDGPVRGNSKIIQELEATFHGAGWNVIKVVWGSTWDELLASDVSGKLLNRLNAMVDGEHQRLSVMDGATIRKEFFEDADLGHLVAHLSDHQLERLPRGGHDSAKVYAAYKQALENKGKPTAILAHTVKGWALGPEIEGRNATHQMKKMTPAQLKSFRDRLHLQDFIPDSALDDGVPPYIRPAAGTDEDVYMTLRRKRLDGFVPSRVIDAEPLPVPDPKTFDRLLQGSEGRPVSTTMGFTAQLRQLMRDPNMGAHVVPIIPDEGRTFGMDALFSEAKIYAPFGQLYDPVDSKLFINYAESAQGQILQEGITEAGAMGSFTAAGTAHVNFGTYCVPFFVFYSMFGFQRVGDFIWAFADSGGKGFLVGATAGRTTLNGEGLQHQDGHSLLLASTVPTVRAYDPAFAYEIAVIVREGIKAMYHSPAQKSCFYYLTTYNENYEMPAMAPGVEDGILRGIYCHSSAQGRGRRATILFSGPSSQAALEARSMLDEDHDVDASCFSVTSYKALREDALECEEHNRLNPSEPKRIPFVTTALDGQPGPVVAVTDQMKAVPDQVARWIPSHFTSLGTDGFGHSDMRHRLRRHFKTDAAHVVVAVLHALVESGQADPSELTAAIEKYL